jgi:putative FmdB family regulatory protein
VKQTQEWRQDMPIYCYRRADGSTFEIKQSFSDEALTTCPDTGQDVTRVISAPIVRFVGGGFYIHDSRGASLTSNVTSRKPSDKKDASDVVEKQSNAEEGKKQNKEVDKQEVQV